MAAREQIFLTATKLIGTGKKGILKPDKDGYYTMPVGALNCVNSAGDFYTAEGCEEIFTGNSLFMRRVKAGNLYGELGHPQMGNMNAQQFFDRAHTILESNQCVHFRRIWLDYNFGKNNPQYNNPTLIAIMAELKPAGPHGPMLKEKLDDPNQNVCFSIRSMTRNYFRGGRTIRVIANAITFDHVTEPGIMIADKYSSPALEAASMQVNEEVIAQYRSGKISMFGNEDSRILTMESVKLYDQFCGRPEYNVLRDW